MSPFLEGFLTGAALVLAAAGMGVGFMLLILTRGGTP